LGGRKWPGVGQICPGPQTDTVLFDLSRSNNNALQKVTRLSRIESARGPPPRLRTTVPSGRNLSAQRGGRQDVSRNGETNR
jgi:hypothetical protein